MNENLKKYHFQLITVQATNESSSAFKAGNISMVDQNVLRYITNEGIYLDYGHNLDEIYNLKLEEERK